MAADIDISVRISDALAAEEIRSWESMESLSRVGRICSSRPWTEVARKSDGIATTFFRVYVGERLVAGTTGDLMPAGISDHYNAETLMAGNSITKGVTPWSASESLMPCMTSTTRAGKSADVRVARGMKVTEQLKYITELFKALRAHGAANGAVSSALLFSPRDSAPVSTAAQSADFIGTPIAESYYMELNCSTFEEYLQRFSSHKRRNIRREHSRGNQNAGVKYETKPLSDALDSHARFAAMNFSKYGEVSTFAV